MWYLTSSIKLHDSKWKFVLDNKLNGKFLIVQASIYFSKQCADKKMNKHDSKFTKIKKILKYMMVHNKHSSPGKMDSLKSHNHQRTYCLH